MRFRSMAGISRFLTVIKLCVGIFWAFYSLRLQKLWRSSFWIEKRKEELYVTQAQYFRYTAVDLGGMLVKLGQFLSTRVDLLPQASIRELANLQDEVPAVSFPDIKAMIESEFGQPLGEVFYQFEEEPLAAASLGQVHRARTRGGEELAVKILRPGIENLVDIDLRAIRRVVDFLKVVTDWEKMMDLEAIYREFAEVLWQELDYIQEGQHAEAIARNSRDDPELLVPYIKWELTTQRVLAMEYMQGIKITDLEGLTRAGIDRSHTARKLLEIYISQILIDGFFHADPHPGNLLITPKGEIIMLDFGMMGSIPPHIRDKLVQLVMALIKRDHFQMAVYLKQIQFLRIDADNKMVARAIGAFIEQLLGVEQNILEIDPGMLLHDLEHILYEHPFQIPANFTFLGRALGTLYGICISLDPQINFLQAAQPFLFEMIPPREDIRATVRDKGAAWGSALVEVPPLLEKVLRQAEGGDLEIRISTSLQDAVKENTRAVMNLAWTMVFSFTILISTYLYVHHFALEARLGFLASLLILWGLWRRSRGVRRRRGMSRGPMVIKSGGDEGEKQGDGVAGGQPKGGPGVGVVNNRSTFIKDERE